MFRRSDKEVYRRTGNGSKICTHVVVRKFAFSKRLRGCDGKRGVYLRLNNRACPDDDESDEAIWGRAPHERAKCGGVGQTRSSCRGKRESWSSLRPALANREWPVQKR